MAGKKGRSGAYRRQVMTIVLRVSLGPHDADLVPFFQDIRKLERGRRNAVLLAAIRGGAAQAQNELTCVESHQVSNAIDALLGAFDV